MAAGSSHDPGARRSRETRAASGASCLPDAARRDLEGLAWRALEDGVRTGRAPHVELSGVASELHAPRATFVTLERRGALRGCIGTLEALEPLAFSVAHNAVKAARDPRLAPVGLRELVELEVKISVLSPLEPLPVTDEAELLAALRPGVDGLVLRDGARGATFLPAVWRSLPRPEDFVRELERKAGLAPDRASDASRFWRYEVEEIAVRPADRSSSA